MSNASLGWSVNDAEVLKSFQKMQAEVDKLKNKLKETEEQSKRTGDSSADSLGGLGDVVADNISSLKGMVAGLFTVDKAIELVTAAYEDWAEQVENVRQRHEDLNQSVVATLARSGALGHGRDFDQFIRSVPGATPEQVVSAFGGVSAAAPQAGYERQKALAGQIAPLAALRPEGFEEFARAVGDIADANPRQSAEDIADLAVGLETLLGEDFSKVSSDAFQRSLSELKAVAGLSDEEALGFGAAAVQADLKPTIMHDLAAALQAHPGTSLQDLLMNPMMAAQILGDEKALQLREVDLLQWQRNTQALRGAAAGDAAAGQVDALREQFPEVARAQAAAELAAKPTAGMLEAADAASIREQMDLAYQAAGYDWMSRTVMARGAWLSSLVADPREAAESAWTRMSALRAEVADRPALTDSQRQANAELVRSIDDLIAALKQQMDEQKGGVNVNAHTEKEP